MILHHPLQLLAWLTALVWAAKSIELLLNLHRVPNLLTIPQTLRRETPSLTVIVPARNEQESVAACIESLLAQDYPNLQILAIDDRSTDATPAILTALAAANPTRLRLITITELPPNWLGKTHAMALAASQSTSDYLLFTDADILFAPTALSRAIAETLRTHADHFVLAPTLILHRWDEAAVLGVFHILGLFAVRFWRVPDPNSPRDAIGVGAFNLVKRTAYEQVGGFEALRMEIIEDLTLGRRIKQSGLAQRVAFGRDLVRVHWASGASGIAEVTTKNLFAAFRFNLAFLLAASLGLFALGVLPIAGLIFAPFRLPALILVAALTLQYRALARHSGIAAAYALLMPFGAFLFSYAMLRSAYLTLRRGGVLWRGTLYPLAELRKRAAPFP